MCRIRIKVEGSEIHIDEYVKEGEEETLNIEDESDSIYELTSVISHVSDPSKKASKHSHLVTQIKGNSKT